MAVQRISTEQFMDKLATSRWLPVTAAVIAFGLLAYALAQWTWRILESPSAGPTTASQQTARSTQTTTLDMQPLLTAHIFGRAESTGPTDPNQLPISALNIVLTGVMARGGSSFAFLSVNG